MFTITDKGDGTAEVYDDGLLIATIERSEAQAITDFDGESVASLRYVAKGVEYKHDSSHYLYTSVASSHRYGGTLKCGSLGVPTWQALNETALDIATQSWKGDERYAEAVEVSGLVAAVLTGSLTRDEAYDAIRAARS